MRFCQGFAIHQEKGVSRAVFHFSDLPPFVICPLFSFYGAF
nr:MAG TPA: hypothetical protein [Caudoviricetes sp.]